MSYFNTDQDNGLFIIIIIMQLSVRTDVLSEPHFLLEEQKLWQQVFAERKENKTESRRSLTFLDSSWTDVRFFFLQFLVEYVQNKADESDALV